jgi:hypothetical protein
LKKLHRRHAGGESRRGFLTRAGTVGLAFSAVAALRDARALVVEIKEDSSLATSSSSPAAAQWLSTTGMRVSPQDSSFRAGHVIAWNQNSYTPQNGVEFGYAYTYSAANSWPTGVLIDSDTGMISGSSSLPSGTYSLTVQVTNRENPNVTAQFPVSLISDPNMVCKTYDTMDTHFGAPAGNDYTRVLANIAAAIQADQMKLGDGNLRATVLFRRGTLYQYTNNAVFNGVRYGIFADSGTGPQPVLQCIANIAQYQNGPLGLGWVGVLNHQGSIKANSPKIAQANPGDTTVALLDPADAAKIVPGRWHIVAAGCQQLNGYPPNITYFDFCLVEAVSGTQVTLDRKLRFSYSPTFYEDPGSDNSIGVARIIPLDTGGAGGYIPADPRIGFQHRWVNITFAANPNTGDNICYVQGYIDISFENCTLTKCTPSMCKHVTYDSCTLTDVADLDKVMETLYFLNCTTRDLAQATGAQYVLVRGGSYGSLGIMSPRQLRMLNATSMNGPAYGVNVSLGHNGPCMFYDYQGNTFLKGSAGHSANIWTWQAQPYGHGEIGPELTWGGSDGLLLVIPRSFGKFDDWLVAVHVGMILTTNGEPPAGSGSWGYISALSSPGDGTAIWAQVVWPGGSKPTSGALYPNGRYRRVNFAGNTFGPGLQWNDPKFFHQNAPGFTSYSLPVGYPFS